MLCPRKRPSLRNQPVRVAVPALSVVQLDDVRDNLELFVGYAPLDAGVADTAFHLAEEQDLINLLLPRASVYKVKDVCYKRGKRSRSDDRDNDIFLLSQV